MEIQKYKNILIISFFIIIYIICLVYLFRKESEISSLILLLIYQCMFIYYLIYKTYTDNSKSNTGTIIWISSLIVSILNFVSLILFTITYYHLYKEYQLDNDKTIPLSYKNQQNVNKFKLFLMISTTLTLFLLFLNTFEITTYGIISILLLLFIGSIIVTSLVITSYNVYISKQIYKLKNVKVISP